MPFKERHFNSLFLTEHDDLLLRPLDHGVVVVPPADGVARDGDATHVGADVKAEVGGHVVTAASHIAAAGCRLKKIKDVFNCKINSLV